MNFLIYLLETSICLIVFYLLYSLFLRNLTHFQWSRFYLVGSLILSLAIPGLNIQLTQEQSPIQFELSQYLPDNNKVEFDNKEPKDIQLSVKENLQIPIENKELKKANDFNWIQFILLIYFLGVVVAGLRFFIGFRKLIALIKTSSAEKMQEFVWLKMPEGFQPSSFFHWVLMDEEKLKEKEILRHELTHVKQWHSLDVLLLEFSAIFLWFNPIIYLFKKDLRKIHEYLADTIAMGGNPKYYAQKMLELATGNKPVILTNSFAFLPLKHRIKMLTKIKSSPISKLNFVLIIPIIGLLFFTFSCVKEDFSALDEAGEITQRKIKSIKSYYVDEMGDQPEKNGTVIGEVHFDLEGKMESLRTSYSSVLRYYDKLSDTQKETNLMFYASPSESIGLIDGYSYGFSHSEIRMYSKFKAVFEKSADEKLVLNGGQIEKFSKVDEIKLEGKHEPNSFVARKENYFENERRIKEENWFAKKGDFFKLASGTDFIYDDNGKLLQLKKYKQNNGSKEYQNEGHLTYNDKQLVETYSSFNKSEFNRKVQYFYDENGIRTSNEVYNTNNQLEFTINFAYEFYD